MSAPTPIQKWNYGQAAVTTGIQPGDSQTIGVSYGESMNDLLFSYAVVEIDAVCSQPNGSTTTTTEINYSVTAENIDSNSANLVISTGATTKINSIVINWIALGN